MGVYCCGDTHGMHDIYKLALFKKGAGAQLTKNDYVIICGDFGLLWNNPYLMNYYGDTKSYCIPSNLTDHLWSADELDLLEWYTNLPWTTLTVLGNHENYDRWDTYPVTEWHGGKVQKLNDSVIRLMNGEIYEIDGHTYFCMGGAMSTDRGPATGTEKEDKGISWWPQEIPSFEEWSCGQKNLEDHDFKVDFIITHDMPEGANYYHRYRISEVSRRLEEIANQVEYKHWFCGHMHEDEDDDYGKISVLYDRQPVNVEDYLKDELFGVEVE